jgi:hypothetical protein
VDLPVPSLGWLALCACHRQARNGRGLASRRISIVLDLKGAGNPDDAHSARGPRSDPQMCRENPGWGAPRMHGVCSRSASVSAASANTWCVATTPNEVAIVGSSITRQWRRDFPKTPDPCGIASKWTRLQEIIRCSPIAAHSADPIHQVCPENCTQLNSCRAVTDKISSLVSIRQRQLGQTCAGRNDAIVLIGVQTSRCNGGLEVLDLSVANSLDPGSFRLGCCKEG